MLWAVGFIITAVLLVPLLMVVSQQIAGRDSSAQYGINGERILPLSFQWQDVAANVHHFPAQTPQYTYLFAGFLSCSEICPIRIQQLYQLEGAIKKDRVLSRIDIAFMFITIDPENDTAPILKDYQEATGIKSSKWQFLRSTVENTKLQAELYMTNFKPNQDGTDFYHSSYVALVDKNKSIRGFYNILIPTEVVRLKEDIKVLLN